MLRALMAASVALTLAVAPARAAEEINFGIISTEASSNLKKIWDPFLADMEKGTGLKINAFFASDYAGVIEGMRFKKVQIAWFGNKSAMEAVDRADGEVFAQTVAANGAGRLLLAHHRAQGQPVPEARRRAEVRQVARFRHRRSELDLGLPGADHLRLLGQEHRPEGCASRRCATPTTRPTRWRSPTSWCTPRPTTARTWSAWRRPRPSRPRNIRVIWTSPLIPSDPLVWRKDLDAGLKKKISDWLFATAKDRRPRRRSWPSCSGRPSRSRTTTSCCRSARWRSTRRS